VGIDTIHDGLSRVETAFTDGFQDEMSKKRAKGQLSTAF
jgi:hypothetical protein